MEIDVLDADTHADDDLAIIVEPTPVEDPEFDPNVEEVLVEMERQLDLEQWQLEDLPGAATDEPRTSTRVIEPDPALADESSHRKAPDAVADGDSAAENAPAPEGALPRARGRDAIPDRDRHDFPILILVHDSGVHGLGVNFCRCSGCPPEHEQLLLHGLFPASIQDPSTAYDVESMDKALVEMLECRTSTEEYWKKLCRFTVPEDPEVTVVSNLDNCS